MSIDPTRRPALLPIPGQQTIRPMFRSLGIAASGLSAQRQRMETIAQNMANADVTRGPDGQPYKRKDVVMEAATSQNALYNSENFASTMGTAAASSSVLGSSAFEIATGDSRKAIEVPVLPTTGGVSGTIGGQYGVRVAGLAEDQGEGRLVYEPGHPDANDAGYVRYPDIDTTQEMVKLMDAKRIFEANAAVFQTAKSMLRASIDI
ncbi:flagellar basal body rod protein FlgC [Gemmatimonas sp.]|uniref:flagellar basal body rod protein FlgC n=1 Tax=Gemmatimonas sp. TaxID=1962908 RepID=UPI00286E38E7|nr:flagellar basal body rod protein FlgC [Gemmatimonas sp.]